MLIQLPFSYRLHYLNAAFFFFFFFSEGLALQTKGDDFPVSLETMRNMTHTQKRSGIKDKLGGGDALFGWAASSAKTLGRIHRISLSNPILL